MSTVKIIVASLVGVAILVICISASLFNDGNAFDSLITFVQMLVVFVLPYVFLFNFWGLRSKLPLFRNKKQAKL